MALKGIKENKTTLQLFKVAESCSGGLLKHPVLYFDQLLGASHAVYWSNSFFSVFKQVFPSFSISNWKKKKKQKLRKNTHTRGVYQHLGATLQHWLTLKCW